MSEFQVLDVTYGDLIIGVQLRWLVLPGIGALRVRDHALWEGARQCSTCQILGYDQGDIDAVLEAQRLGVERAPRVVDSVGGPRCEACA